MRRFNKGTSKSGRSRDLFEAAPKGAADPEIDPGKLEKEIALKDIENTAVRLLSRREHSTEELRRKLAAKGYPESGIATVVEKLATKKQVSDERFVSSYVHHHARRGKGPVRIRAQLRQQGVTDSQIQQEVSVGETDWTRLAGEVRRRKFGAELPSTASERAKQARFLQYRGFNSDQIRAALKFDPDMDDGSGA
ncbi:MAG: regulatory protein RecX [Steroidobacter sp.]